MGMELFAVVCRLAGPALPWTLRQLRKEWRRQEQLAEAAALPFLNNIWFRRGLEEALPRKLKGTCGLMWAGVALAVASLMSSFVLGFFSAGILLFFCGWIGAYRALAEERVLTVLQRHSADRIAIRAASRRWMDRCH